MKQKSRKILLNAPSYYAIAITRDSFIYTQGSLDTVITKTSIKTGKKTAIWRTPQMIGSPIVPVVFEEFFIHKNELYGFGATSIDSVQLVKINLQKDRDYQVIMGHKELKGCHAFANASPTCDTSIIYAVRGFQDVTQFQDDTTTIVRVDLETKKITPICQSLDMFHTASLISSNEIATLDCRLMVDLDQDNSSKKTKDDFKTQVICGLNQPVFISDNDLFVNTEHKIDSIVCYLEKGVKSPSFEQLFISSFSNKKVKIEGSGTNKLSIINNGYAKSWDFKEVLAAVQYQHIGSGLFSIGERVVRVLAYSGDTKSDTSRAYISLERSNAGKDTIITLCDEQSIDLYDYIKGATYRYGAYYPKLSSGTSIFNPLKDKSNTYMYVVSASSVCKDDTCVITIKPSPKPIVLNIDTTLCFGNDLTILNKKYTKPGSYKDFISYRNNCDSLQLNLNLKFLPKSTITIDTIIELGQAYTLADKTYQNSGRYIVNTLNSQNCDSTIILNLEVKTNDLNDYLPSIITPNSNDENSNFGFLPKLPIRLIKEMLIFNRWGQLIFQVKDIEPNNVNAYWNGGFNGTIQPSDVYTYSIQVVMNNGIMKTIKGNVTLIR